MIKKIQFAPGAELSTELSLRTASCESPHLTARRMAARYVEMCRSAIPYFEPCEWRAIAGANGPVAGAGAMWPRAVAYELTTSDLAERFGLDGSAFLARLEALSLSQAFAALDVLERYDALRSRGKVAALPGEARLAH